MSDRVPPRLPLALRKHLVTLPPSGERVSSDEATWTTTLHLLPDVGAFYEEYAAHLGLSAETLLTLIAMGMVPVLKGGRSAP